MRGSASIRSSFLPNPSEVVKVTVPASRSRMPIGATALGTAPLAGAWEDRLDIRIVDVLSDVEHDMGEAATLEKEGAEAELQELLAESPERCGEGLRLVRREFPTDIGPVDLLCRDAAEGYVAVEIKRVGTIEAVEQLSRHLERMR